MTTTATATAPPPPATTPATTNLESETTRTTFETIKIEGWQLLEQVKRLIHEGNVRRINVKQGDHTIVEFPLTIGVVGTLIAPVLAAVGAIAALLADCTLEIERTDTPKASETTATPMPPIQPPSPN